MTERCLSFRRWCWSCVRQPHLSVTPSPTPLSGPEGSFPVTVLEEEAVTGEGRG